MNLVNFLRSMSLLQQVFFKIFFQKTMQFIWIYLRITRYDGKVREEFWRDFGPLIRS